MVDLYRKTGRGFFDSSTRSLHRKTSTGVFQNRTRFFCAAGRARPLPAAAGRRPADVICGGRRRGRRKGERDGRRTAPLRRNLDMDRGCDIRWKEERRPEGRAGWGCGSTPAHLPESRHAKKKKFAGPETLVTRR